MVRLASFLPTIRHDIAVAAGSERELRINLPSVLNSVDLTPGSAPPGTLITDDWKWVLRSSHATRPVLRLQPGTSSSRTSLASVFSDTTGMVRFSAGDGYMASGNMQQDLGTAFAVATSVNGPNRVHVSGNLVYAASGVPSAGLRTTYSRDNDADGTSGPRMSLTVRQIYLPALPGSGAAGSTVGTGQLEGDAPILRTLTLSVIDSLKLTDALNFEYGFGMDSVSLFGRISYFSPFARATYDLGRQGAVRIAYSSGGTPTELIHGGAGSTSDVSQDLAALGQLPNISRRDNDAAVQRTRTYEAGYQIKRGSRTYTASVYRDEVSNAAFLISDESGVVASSDLLPDLNSRGIVYNVGDFRRGGYGMSVEQALGDHAEFSVGGGRGDALVASSGVLIGDLRSSIHNEARPWVTARVGGSIPQSGTYLGTSYGWSDFQRSDAHARVSHGKYQSTDRLECPRAAAAARGGQHAHGSHRGDAEHARAGLPDHPVRRSAGRAHQFPARGPRRFELHFLGCCCVMQCSVPNPNTRSRQGIPITARLGNRACSLRCATESCLSPKAGISTKPLAM